MKFLHANPNNGGGNKFDSFLPIEIHLQEIEVRRLHALCTQVFMMRGWWAQYGEAVKVLNERVYESFKNRLSEAWTCSEYFLSANKMPALSDDYVFNFPFGAEDIDQRYYVLTHK